MDQSLKSAAKAKQLREFFAKHGRIYIMVNTTDKGVIVPDHLKQELGLPLVLNSRMPQHIHIHATALESTFSFSGQAFGCYIPMHAIWAAYLPEQSLEQAIYWEDALPEEMRSMMFAESSIDAPEPKQAAADDKKKGGRGSHLRVVK
ncbi:MAG: ClpXP protease specificity-enhancing factor SspB [Mariprofundaceae bacterium]